ncbi:salivary glue protein Sgs-3-like [Saccostrea cucullata]|uniref:salivary glue protein Sgs-3-like n=1 Tax=Saccostrea cuccullata TaxID=36930 RepID=UPI002ED696CF
MERKKSRSSSWSRILPCLVTMIVSVGLVNAQCDNCRIVGNVANCLEARRNCVWIHTDRVTEVYVRRCDVEVVFSPPLLHVPLPNIRTAYHRCAINKETTTKLRTTMGLGTTTEELITTKSPTMKTESTTKARLVTLTTKSPTMRTASTTKARLVTLTTKSPTMRTASTTKARHVTLTTKSPTMRTASTTKARLVTLTTKSPTMRTASTTKARLVTLTTKSPTMKTASTTKARLVTLTTADTKSPTISASTTKARLEAQLISLARSSAQQEGADGGRYAEQ